MFPRQTNAVIDFIFELLGGIYFYILQIIFVIVNTHDVKKYTDVEHYNLCMH